MKRVIVHIDRLVLKGFKREDQYSIAMGLQQELTQIFASPLAAQQLTARSDESRLRVGNIAINSGSHPQSFGMDAARSVGKEMAK